MSRGGSRTGATSTSGSAVRSSGPSTSSGATRWTRWRGSRPSPRVRGRSAEASVVHGDTRELAVDGGPFDAVVTSPPYPGLIDYHEQHRYAYELLGLDDRRELEVGAAAAGTSKRGARRVLRRDRRRAAQRRAASCGRARPSRSSSTTAAISTRRSSNGPSSGLEGRLRRHVNRRTGRRAGEFFEDVLHRARPSVTPCTASLGGVLARTLTHALVGLDARRVEVEAHVSSATRRSPSSGSPTGRARRRSIACGAGSPPPSFFPSRRITVNLAPADLRKEGSGFDLPIALAVLGASHQVPRRSAWRPRRRRRARPRRPRPPRRRRRSPRRGARRAGWSGCSARPNPRRRRRWPESSRCPSRISREAAPICAARASRRAVRARTSTSRRRPRTPDLADVRGPGARPAGARARGRRRHNLLLAGPPGTGKTMLARRLPGLLPPLEPDEALEVTRIHSVAGLLPPDRPLIARRRRSGRRTTAPRWRRSSAAGRGRVRARPAWRTAACCSSTSWPSSRARRSRRCASRSRTASSAIARGTGRAVFPARFQLVGDDEPVPLRGARRSGGRVLVLAAAARGLPRQALAGAARPVRPRRHGAAAARG